MRVYYSFGAMLMMLSYLRPIEKLRLQALNKWWYTIGVGRCQLTIVKTIDKYLYFSCRNELLMYERATGKKLLLDPSRQNITL